MVTINASDMRQVDYVYILKVELTDLLIQDLILKSIFDLINWNEFVHSVEVIREEIGLEKHVWTCWM